MTAAPPLSFIERYLMARKELNPAEFGVTLDREEFTDTLLTAFSDYTRGQFSFDEFLLRPRSVVVFCDQIRSRFGWFDLPDDVMLRAIMNRRKNPG